MTSRKPLQLIAKPFASRLLQISRNYSPPQSCSDEDKPLMTIDCKVAAIVGGTGGIGFAAAHCLLENKLCHIALIDQDVKCGREAVSNLNCAYGKDKAIFIKGDATKGKDMDEAFSNTLKEFKKLDIVVNAAGVWDGCHWEKEADVNLKGATNVLLAAQKIMCQHGSGFLLNFAGIQGLEAFSAAPTLAGSFAGAIGLCRSYGHINNYEKSKLRVVTVCTGLTRTDFVKDVAQKALNAEMGKCLDTYMKEACWQKPVVCGKTVVQLAKYGLSGTVWIIEGSRLFLLDFPHWKRHSILVTQFV